MKISKDIKLVDYKISFEDVFNENILKVVKDLVYEKLERIEECDDFSYENFDISDISEFATILKNNPNLKGLNITIPYKEMISLIWIKYRKKPPK